MPKLGMGPIRRKQLIAAAIASIHDYGFAEATVAKIAAKAGVSTGMVHHYFADKNDLLAATMRSLLEILRSDAVARLRRAGSPRARVDAVINAAFGDTQFDDDVFSAWLALYGNARSSKRLQRILRIYHRRLDSNLRSDLAPLIGRDAAGPVAFSIAALIDGLWLRYALTGRPANPETPRTLTRDYVDSKLAAVSGRQAAKPQRVEVI
jgi:TetR/AcrR family transcriptional regulator, transcriptional repressor of bet genes